MGTSCTLLKKEFLELSLEIDRDLSIEISTGFGKSERCTTSASMPITMVELDEIIIHLQDLQKRLKASWKCKNCGAINPEEENQCNTCDKTKDYIDNNS